MSTPACDTFAQRQMPKFSLSEGEEVWGVRAGVVMLRNATLGYVGMWNFHLTPNEGMLMLCCGMLYYVTLLQHAISTELCKNIYVLRILTLLPSATWCALEDV